MVANRGTEQLRFFTEDGSFLGAVGRDGNGPEEFRGLSWIAVRGDSLLARDWGNDRLSVRDQSGAYGRSFRLQWTSGLLAPLILMNGGTLLALSVRPMTELDQTGTQVEPGLVSRHDLEGAMIDSVGRYPVSHRVVHREGILQKTVGLPLSSDAGFALVLQSGHGVSLEDWVGWFSQLVELAPVVFLDPTPRAAPEFWWRTDDPDEIAARRAESDSLLAERPPPGEEGLAAERAVMQRWVMDPPRDVQVAPDLAVQ